MSLISHVEACITPFTYEPGFPLAWEGLDLASAEQATPKWFGVSSGNGNDGVSHMWPDYYVRTCDPFRLAELAMVACFKPEFYAWAIEHTEVDGEAEYTISAIISDPPDDGERDHSQCEDGDDCEGCDECEVEGNSWSDANGAWKIVEVWAIDDMDDKRSSAMRYESLTDAFSVDVLALVEQE